MQGNEIVKVLYGKCCRQDKIIGKAGAQKCLWSGKADFNEQIAEVIIEYFPAFSEWTFKNRILSLEKTLD